MSLRITVTTTVQLLQFMSISISYSQLFQKGATFNFLGKKLRNQIYFPQNLIANQVVGMLGVFNSGSFVFLSGM